MPPETLPGNPTDAGPDTRSNEPPPAWDDCMIFAEDATANSRRARRVATSEDIKAQLDAIHLSREWLLEAEFNLLGMLTADEIIAMRLTRAR